MAWEDLSSEIGALFGEFTCRADQMIAALAKQLEAQRRYKREWMKRYRAANPRYRANERRRMNERRQRLTPEQKAANVARVQEWRKANPDKLRAHREKAAAKRRQAQLVSVPVMPTK